MWVVNMTMSLVSSQVPSRGVTFLGHPRGLVVASQVPDDPRTKTPTPSVGLGCDRGSVVRGGV